MPQVELQRYCFSRKSHWAICGRDGFITDEKRLVTGGGSWKPISTIVEDRHLLAIVADIDDGFIWLRHSGELVSIDNGRMVVHGVLDANVPTVGGYLRSNHMAVSGDRVWLASDGYLRIYHWLHLQQLSVQRIGVLIALAADCTGAWCLLKNEKDSEGNKDRWFWRHFDFSGRVDLTDIPFGKAGEPLGGTIDPNSGRLYVFDKDSVWSRHPCESKWSHFIDYRSFDCRFEPASITIDCDANIHILSTKQSIIWSFDEKGVRIGHREIPIGSEPNDAEIGMITAGSTITFAGSEGIFQLTDSFDSRPQATPGKLSEAIVLTPTLVSPRAQGGSWQRARICADLPLGATLRVRVAASDDDNLKDRVAEIGARSELSATQRLMAIDGLLPWNENFETVLTKDDDPLRLGQFDVLLDGICSPYLWLAIHIFIPPTSSAATLRALELRYPARSWIEDLPAPYRAEPKRAAELRRFLAVMETVFDDLEECIEALPERLSTSDSNDIWINFLLSWIGLPLPPDVPVESKRVFLNDAPNLLHYRGTLWALERALQTATGLEVQINDYGDGPLPWLLNSDSAVLGRSTMLVRQNDTGFTLGRMTQLNRDKLGRHLANNAEIIAQKTLELQIEIKAGTADVTSDIDSIVEAVLGYFLPAACRYELLITPLKQSRQGRRLDIDARLAHIGDEVGRSHTLGHSAISEAYLTELRLDHRARLDDSRHLS